MRRRFASVAVVAVLAVGGAVALAGCGDDDDFDHGRRMGSGMSAQMMHGAGAGMPTMMPRHMDLPGAPADMPMGVQFTLTPAP